MVGEMIKAIIDLGGGEPVRIKFKESSAGEILWIEIAFPAWIRPALCTNEDLRHATV